MPIQEIRADHYRVPLPVALSDSTHGTMTHFELVTVRLHDGEGAEGLGYTYSVGAGGAAIHALIARDLEPLLAGQEADRIEKIWERMWWGLHFVGRGSLAGSWALVSLGAHDRSRRAASSLQYGTGAAKAASKTCDTVRQNDEIGGRVTTCETERRNASATPPPCPG